MAVAGGLDLHRGQLTFDYVDLGTGEARRGRICPADRESLRDWLGRFDGALGVEFAVEGCTGWRYVVEELQRAGITAHLVLAATLFAHDPAALRVHGSAWLGEDRWPGRWLGLLMVGGAGGEASSGPGVLPAGRACWFAEQAGERADRLEQQGVDAGLLVGGVPGSELGDGAAVLGLGGELA